MADVPQAGQSGAPDPMAFFEELARVAEQQPGVSRNRRGSLVLINKGVRAMTSKGTIVVKLKPERVLELVEAGEGVHYKGQANAWLELAPALSKERCRRLVEESLHD